jgi:hypothetical protein
MGARSSRRDLPPGASKTSVWMERIGWLIRCGIIAFCFFLGGMEVGKGERIVRVPGSGWSRTLILYGTGSMM